MLRIIVAPEIEDLDQSIKMFCDWDFLNRDAGRHMYLNSTSVLFTYELQLTIEYMRRPPFQPLSAPQDLLLPPNHFFVYSLSFSYFHFLFFMWFIPKFITVVGFLYLSIISSRLFIKFETFSAVRDIVSIFRCSFRRGKKNLTQKIYTDVRT